MRNDRERRRMRAAVGVGIGPIARQLIALAREENEWFSSLAATSGGTREQAHGGQPAADGLPGRIRPRNVQSFVDSCPPKQRTALAALLLLGRDPLVTTAADVEAVAETHTGRRDLGQYLGDKGHLDEYLQRALDLLGL